MHNRSLRAGRVLFFSGLTIWLGGMAALGAIVAPVLFSKFSKDDAGAAFGEMLRRFNYLEIGCAVGVLGGMLLLCTSVPHVTRVDIVRLVLSIVMVLNLVTGLVFVNRPLERLRREIPSFESQIRDDRDLEARKRFKRLHGLSEILFGVNFLTGFALMVLSAAPIRHDRDDHPRVD